MSRVQTYRAMLAPGMIVLALLSLVPLTALVYLSLRSWSLIVPGSNEFVGLGNFVRMLDDGRFWNSLWVSIYYIVVNTLLQLTIGFGLALAFFLDLRGTRWLRVLFLLPMLIPPIVVGLAWRMLFTPSLGGINYFLSTVGIQGPDWLNRPFTALAAITVAAVWEWTPLVMLVLLAGLESLPREPFEAALIDGATFRQTVAHVILPLLKPVILVVAILRIIDSLGILPLIFVMTSGGPSSATESINFYAYESGINFLHISYASSLLVVFIMLMLAFSVTFIRNALKVRA